MRGIDDECTGSWTHQVLRALRGRPVHVARFSLSRVVRDDCEWDRVRVGKPVSGWDGWMGLCGDRSDSTEQTEGRGESFGVDFPVPMAGWRGLTRSLRRLHVRRFALTARKRATTRAVAPYVAATPRDRSRVSRTAGLRRDSSAQPATSTALDANPSARLLPRNARRP